jgi:ArsR family transcriptional regulator
LEHKETDPMVASSVNPPGIAAASGQSKKPVRLSAARRTAILKALADPRRFELLEHIARSSCPLGCSEARAALPISAATLSHHVKELASAGLIDVRREGKFHFLTLRPGVLEGLIALLARLESSTCP